MAFVDVLLGSILFAAASHKPIISGQHQHQQNSGMKKRDTVHMERLCFVGRVYVFLHPKASKKRAAQTNWNIQGRDNDGGGRRFFHG